MLGRNGIPTAWKKASQAQSGDGGDVKQIWQSLTWHVYSAHWNLSQSSRGSGHTRGGKGSFDTEVRVLERVYPKRQYMCSAESAELCRKRDLSSNKFR